MEFSLFSKVNHKIKGLLTIIQEGINVVAEDVENTTDSQREFLGMSQSISRYLTAFIVDFMKYVKIKNEKNGIISECFKIEDVLGLEKNGNLEKKVILKNAANNNLFGSQDLMLTVLNKLLKYVDKNSEGSNIIISLDPCGDRDVRVTLSADKFVVSSKDFLEALNTYDSSFSDNDVLTGFELLLSNEILKLHGSEISINSQDEKVKELYFDIPRSRK